MEIKLNSELIYRQLEEPMPDLKERNFTKIVEKINEGESWKQKKETSIPVQSKFYGDYNPIPFPFRFAVPSFKRQGDFYSGDIFFVSHELPKKYFERLSVKLKSIYKKNWVSINIQGAGLILYNKDPVISISRFIDQYHINFGREGAIQRKFSSIDDFVSDMISVEKATTNFIIAGMKLSKNKVSIPDVTFYLS